MKYSAVVICLTYYLLKWVVPYRNSVFNAGTHLYPSLVKNKDVTVKIDESYKYHLFCNPAWSGSLNWRLRPNSKNQIEGRSELPTPN